MKAKKIIAGLSVVAALGAAVVPLSAVHAETANETINVIVNSALFMEIEGTQTTTMGAGEQNLTSLYDAVFAATTSSTGYSLTIAATSAPNVNMVNAAGDLIAGAATPLAAGTLGAGTPGTNYSGGSYTCGINATAFTAVGQAWANVAPGTQANFAWAQATATMPTTTPVLISSTTSANGASRPVSNGYMVRYGVTTAADQPVGTYTTQVTFTLVDNN